MTYFDRETEVLPRAQLQSLQFRKLQAMLAHLGQEPLLHRQVAAAGWTPRAWAACKTWRAYRSRKTELLANQEQVAPFGSNCTYPAEAYVRRTRRWHHGRAAAGAGHGTLVGLVGRCWGMCCRVRGRRERPHRSWPLVLARLVGFWGAVEGAVQRWAPP